MTRDEFFAKYGDVKVKFSSYYKYAFTYMATLPGDKTLTCGVGGNADDIYRHEVSATAEETVNSLDLFYGAVHDSGEMVEGFYDY